LFEGKWKNWNEQGQLVKVMYFEKNLMVKEVNKEPK
jgi:hypothetical protein